MPVSWVSNPVAGRAPFAVGFLTALAAQLALVFGSLMAWNAAHMGPRVLALLETALRMVFAAL